MTDFANEGFRIFKIPQEIADRLAVFFDDKYRRQFDSNDCIASYSHTKLSARDVAILNRNHVYYGPVNDPKPLTDYLRDISQAVEFELGHPWRVGNVRAWKTVGREDFGPTQWHTDELPPDAIKMMIYPQPLNAENGSLELIDREQWPHHLITTYPTCVLFDNNALRHRGRPGRHDRCAIEVLTLPAERTVIEYVYAGQNARVPA
jgi:hypothetical protein